MNMLEAMRDTVKLAEARNPDARVEGLHDSLLLPHLIGMLDRMERDANPQDPERGFSEGKMGRWLGWAQAAVTATGVASLEDMKEINRRWAGN